MGSCGKVIVVGGSCNKSWAQFFSSAKIATFNINFRSFPYQWGFTVAFSQTGFIARGDIPESRIADLVVPIENELCFRCAILLNFWKMETRCKSEVGNILVSY